MHVPFTSKRIFRHDHMASDFTLTYNTTGYKIGGNVLYQIRFLKIYLYTNIFYRDFMRKIATVIRNLNPN